MPGKYLVSVNAESKETEHDGIARKVLEIVSDKNDSVEDYLEHGKDKAEELSKEPVVNKQDKKWKWKCKQQLQKIISDYSCLVLTAWQLPAYLNNTSCHHRENTALDRVSVESLSEQHDQEQEVTKQTKDDEDRVENYNKYE